MKNLNYLKKNISIPSNLTFGLLKKKSDQDQEATKDRAHTATFCATEHSEYTLLPLTKCLLILNIKCK